MRNGQVERIVRGDIILCRARNCTGLEHFSFTVGEADASRHNRGPIGGPSQASLHHSAVILEMSQFGGAAIWPHDTKRE